MQRDLRACLADVQMYTAELLEKTSRRSLDDYRESREFQLAVDRLLSIVGEAVVRVEQATSREEVAKRITDVRKVIAFRHVMVHAYDEIIDTVVWDVVERHLPRLKKDVDTWAAELGITEENQIQ